MSKVKLGEVAIEHKETCKGSKDGSSRMRSSFLDLQRVQGAPSYLLLMHLFKNGPWILSKPGLIEWLKKS